LSIKNLKINEFYIKTSTSLSSYFLTVFLKQYLAETNFHEKKEKYIVMANVSETDKQVRVHKREHRS